MSLFSIPTAILVFFSLMSFSVAAAPARDVRILVDVSGSMKLNDPQNLRSDALNMLVELLPAGTNAGIWQFGSEVRPLIKHGPVNLRWRLNAKKSINGMNSNQQFTKLGHALEQSSVKPFIDNKAVYIVITDGQIDISSDRLKNYQERNRILDNLVPHLASRGAQINTIALSENADQQLLDFAAFMSHGSFAYAQSAQNIKQQLLQIFDDSLAVDELPIKANKFYVDRSVSEFTALIFHKGKYLEVLAPGGELFTSDSSVFGVTWAKGDHYSLVTVKEPKAGTWQIGGKILSNSRISVVSDVRLKLEALPENLWLGDPLNISFFLEHSGGIVTDHAFLEKMTTAATLHSEQGSKAVKINTVSPKWRVSSDALEHTGLWRLSVEIDGQSFQRKRTFAVNVRSPLSFVSIPRNEGYEIRLEVLKPALKDKSAKMMANIEGPGLYQKRIELKRHDKGYWFAFVSPEVGEGAYKVTVIPDITGLTSAMQQQIVVAPLWLNFPVIDAHGSAKTVLNNTPVEIAPTVPMSVMLPALVPTDTMSAEVELIHKPWNKYPIVRVAETMADMALMPSKMVVPMSTNDGVTKVPDAWDDTVETETKAESENWWAYLIASVFGLAFMVAVYIYYRKFEQRMLAKEGIDLEDELSLEEQSILDEVSGKAVRDDSALNKAVNATTVSEVVEQVSDEEVEIDESIFDQIEEPELDDDINEGMGVDIDESKPEPELGLDDFDLAEEDEIEEEKVSEPVEETSQDIKAESSDEDDELDAILDDLDDDFGDLDEELEADDDDLDDLLDIGDDDFDDDDDDDFDPLASLDDFDDLDD